MTNATTSADSPGSDYERDGYLGPVRLIDEAGATDLRTTLESTEDTLGPLHYRNKVNCLLADAYALCVAPTVLDVVESLLGPDILLYNATFIIKEPHSKARVAWHQDLTYWGLDDPHGQVSMWLALAPATVESGCMHFLPGSHRIGALPHAEGDREGNVLLLGQHVTGVDSDAAHPCVLAPGEASFHHGWTLHTSAPNVSSDRRIGLNAQYITPGTRQIGAVGASAMLVRGDDRFGYYERDVPAPEVSTPESVARWEALDAAMRHGFVN